jgi:hypothetical protein
VQRFIYRPLLWQSCVQFRLWQFWQFQREHVPETLKIAAWFRPPESAPAFFFSISGSAMGVVIHILITRPHQVGALI